MADLLHSLILLPYPAQALVAVMAIAGLWFGSDKVIWGVRKDKCFDGKYTIQKHFFIKYV